MKNVKISKHFAKKSKIKKNQAKFQKKKISKYNKTKNYNRWKMTPVLKISQALEYFDL